MSRKSKARKGSRDSLRDRYLARSRSQTDVAIQSPPAPSQPLVNVETVPSAVAPSSQTGLYIAQDAAFFPSQPGPSLFIPYEEPVFTVSSPETLSEGVIGSSHNEVASGSASRTHARAQEKAARAASAPTVKHKITDEVRKKRAEKAKRKRGRDVDDRIRLNNVLPEDRRATLDPPGLVETMRKAHDYIVELKSDLDVKENANVSLLLLNRWAEEAENIREEEVQALRTLVQELLEKVEQQGETDPEPSQT